MAERLSRHLWLRALGTEEMPARITLAGETYDHARTYKHDFFAATGLYDGPSGRVILKLGAERVPHGQEVRVAPFRGANGAPLMVIRYNAHTTGVQVVDTQGTTVRELDLNPSPNNTGMEAVYWTAGVPAGISVPLCNTGMEAVCRTAGVPAGIDALLYNGGMLWDPMQGIGVPLPGLPAPDPIGRMAWYHCIPADICGDRREELVLYNPWTAKVYIYTQADNDSATLALFRPGPRQYNPRLMD